MRIRLLVCVGLVAAGLLLVWRPWTATRKPRLIPPADTPHHVAGTGHLTAHGPASVAAFEESEPVEVIDLTQLQLYRPEPEVVDAPPPRAETLPCEFGVRTGVPVVAGTPVVREFLPHAAVDVPVTLASEKHGAAECPLSALVRFVWGLSTHKPEEERKTGYVPPVMPHHHDQHSCPYVGGRSYDSGQYRSVKVPARPTGDETQDQPKVKPVKRNTLEIQPGDLPAGWLWRPF